MSLLRLCGIAVDTSLAPGLRRLNSDVDPMATILSLNPLERAEALAYEKQSSFSIET